MKIEIVEFKGDVFSLKVIDKLTEDNIINGFYTINGYYYSKGKVCESTSEFYMDVFKHMGIEMTFKLNF